jgi:putative PIN family toxin of toxin-antitoxin system
MGKVKAVLDTNVLVSILFKKTLAREFSQVIEKQKIEIYTSKEILKELARVMTYPKIESIFKKSGVNKRSALVSLTGILKVVEPKKRINIIKVDPSDNKILECGIEAKVKYIVSGDKHLLKLKKFKNIQIITPREFLEKIS